MRWRLWRRNGHAAAEAREEAEQGLRDAHEQDRQVDRTVRAAREMARQTDLFVRGVENALHRRWQ